MNVDLIKLVEKENKYFLMDGCTCSPTVIDELTYAVLNALKKMCVAHFIIGDQKKSSKFIDSIAKIVDITFHHLI